MPAFAKRSNSRKKTELIRYQSPFQILDRAGIHIDTTLQKSDLLLSRKILLAEFELSNKTTIPWNGQEMTRDDVLKRFEVFEASNTLEYHHAIAQDEILSNFIGKHEFSYEPFEPNPLYQTIGFKQFIGPYFLAALQKNFYYNFVYPHADSAAALLELVAYLDEPTAQQFWDKTRAELDKKLAALKEAQDDLYAHGIYIGEAGETKYFHPELIDILNLLPEPFEQYRTLYGTALVELAAACLGRRRGDTGIYILTQASFLEVEESLQATIKTRLKIMKKLGYRPERNTSDFGLVSVTVLIFYFILFSAFLLSVIL